MKRATYAYIFLVGFVICGVLWASVDFSKSKERPIGFNIYIKNGEVRVKCFCGNETKFTIGEKGQACSSGSIDKYNQAHRDKPDPNVFVCKLCGGWSKDKRKIVTHSCLTDWDYQDESGEKIPTLPGGFGWSQERIDAAYKWYYAAGQCKKCGYTFSSGTLVYTRKHEKECTGKGKKAICGYCDKKMYAFEKNGHECSKYWNKSDPNCKSTKHSKHYPTNGGVELRCDGKLIRSAPTKYTNWKIEHCQYCGLAVETFGWYPKMDRIVEYEDKL